MLRYAQSGHTPNLQGFWRLKRAFHSTQHRWMSRFSIVEHTIRGQHTRDRRAGAELGHDNNIRLHVKQYVSKTSENPASGDVTIIGAQANGFPKEVYEPFWDDLSEKLEFRGRRIRGIWIADVASLGQSGILNERVLGPDASWWDHGRDLLFLINQFQDEIPHPIIGVGHSFGASHLAHLSLLHPRLLDSLIMVDPIMQRNLGPHTTFAKLSTSRRDIWPSRNAAAEKFKANKFYQQWDSRVLDRFIQHAFRELPTEKYPELPEGSDANNPPVTLSSTVAQEVYFYARAMYPEERLLQDDVIEQDVHPEDRIGLSFGRPESQELYRRLPEFKPSVLYIFGEKSEASPSEYRRDKLHRTGTGVGGSGGAAKGKVQEAVLSTGHLVAMEKPTECADAAAKFMNSELDRWDAEERKRRDLSERLSRKERVEINEAWKAHLEDPSGLPEPVGSKKGPKL